MKFIVIGLGYVGLSISVYLSRSHEVIGIDIDKKKINNLKKKILPFYDKEIQSFLKKDQLNLSYSYNLEECLSGVDYVIICTPTDYNSELKSFDTSSITKIIKKVNDINNKIPIIIRSTIPIGFTDKMKQKFNHKFLFFSPEFLREGSALFDNLYPSRIIVGGNCNKAKKFGQIMHELALKKDVKLFFMSSKEAESAKLFSNSYLASRVAFFNELDTFALSENLDSKILISGVCSDERIGNYYNNPSFGYGGYCLPKDSKQLISSFGKLPQVAISAVVKSNEIRLKFIADTILKRSAKVIGIYRLTMKSGSDNFKNSPIIEIINFLAKKKINILVYEPLLKNNKDDRFNLLNNLDEFKQKSELVVANRIASEIKNISYKVFTRDIFKNN